MEPYPLWTGDERFVAGLDALIGQPRRHPHHFHVEALPIRRLAAVYGNRGAQKRRVIEAYCRALRDDCSVLHIRVASSSPPDLEEARKQIDDILRPVDSPYGVDAVVLINHAQHFQRDPHSMTWQRKAQEANVVVFALLDATLEAPEFKAIFAKAQLYLSPPNSSAVRIAQMRWHFAHYAAKCPEAAPNVDLSDDEWAQLADQFTKLASARHLKHYVLRFIYERHTHITYALATGPPYVSYSGGEGAHIVGRALATEENAFSMAAGQGPLLNAPALQPRVKKQKIEAEIEEALLK
jgi:hypothetical protein